MKIVNIEEILEKEDLYYCGSPPLKRFLEDNGIIHVNSYTKKNGKDIYLFIKNDELSKLLTTWSNNRPL